jgi:hypothetical protein
MTSPRFELSANFLGQLMLKSKMSGVTGLADATEPSYREYCKKTHKIESSMIMRTYIHRNTWSIPLDQTEILC